MRPVCGRYAIHSFVREIQEHFGALGELTLAPTWNAAPSRQLPVVRTGTGGREVALCEWGFVPAWMKETPKSRPINAKAETAAEKPYFRDAFRRRRCLVPANGFYEWQRDGRRRQPWYFRLEDEPLFAFAGLWDRWNSPTGPLETFTILTTDANDTVRPVHPRMPVVLHPSGYERWLEQGDRSVIVPYPGPMRAFPVSTRVNSPTHDDAGLIAPFDPPGANAPA